MFTITIRKSEVSPAAGKFASLLKQETSFTTEARGHREAYSFCRPLLCDLCVSVARSSFQMKLHTRGRRKPEVHLSK